MNLLGQGLATALFPSSPQQTTLQDLPSPSNTNNVSPLPCMNEIQARSCQRILPSVWTVGIPYFSYLTSTTRPEMTAGYIILNFPFNNLTVSCISNNVRELENNLIFFYRKHWGVVRGKSIQQSSRKALCILHHSQENLGPNSISTLMWRWFREIPYETEPFSSLSPSHYRDRPLLIFRRWTTQPGD